MKSPTGYALEALGLKVATPKEIIEQLALLPDQQLLDVCNGIKNETQPQYKADALIASALMLNLSLKIN